jgi:uncharacterized membrane protein
MNNMQEPARLSKLRFATLRNAFLSGSVILAPFFVTGWVLFSLLELIGGGVRDHLFFFLPEGLRTHSSLAVVWNILATLIVVLSVTLFGYVSRNILGRYFGRLAERLIQNIPVVKGIYNTVKQIIATFGTQNRTLFGKVVLLQFPRTGLYSIGFLTNKSQGEIQARAGLELWMVFVPTSPNPTSGYLLLLPKADLIELDMSVSDGMKLVVSGGAVMPDWPAPTAVPPPADG